MISTLLETQERERMLDGHFTSGEEILLRDIYEWIGPNGDGGNGRSPAAVAWRAEVETGATNMEFGAWVGETFIQVVSGRIAAPWLLDRHDPDNDEDWPLAPGRTWNFAPDAPAGMWWKITVEEVGDTATLCLVPGKHAVQSNTRGIWATEEDAKAIRARNRAALRKTAR